MTSNTVVVGGETVQTGNLPVWLVELLYSPPEWLPYVLGACMIVVLGLTYLGYRRHGVDDNVVRESLANGIVVACTGGCATVLAASGLIPLVASIAGGSAAGFGISLIVQARLGLR